MNFYLLLICVFSLFCGCCCGTNQGRTIKECKPGTGAIFPEKSWLLSDPEEQGMDPEVLEKMEHLMEKAQANGVLIRNGYIVAEWNFSGGAEKRLEVQSISKSITSLMLGLAYDKKLISSLDKPVKKYYPALDVGPYTEKITFRHLVTMSSGISPGWSRYQKTPPLVPPGTGHHYHNDQYSALAKALTYVFRRELRDILKEEILNIIGADMEWGYDGNVEISGGKQIKVNAGYAFTWWTARDLARVGYLYLNNGKWEDRQLLSCEYVRETFTPIDLKINEYSLRHMAKIDPEKNAKRVEALSKLRYGLGWWTGKAGFYNGWAMSGNGGQFCLIIPEYNLVMTKINNYNVKPYVGIGYFYPILIKSLKKKGQSK